VKPVRILDPFAKLQPRTFDMRRLSWSPQSLLSPPSCGRMSLSRSTVRNGRRPCRVVCRHNSTASQAAPASNLPAHIPPMGCVNLTPLRGLLAVHGIQSAKFLHRLITKKFPSQTEPTGMFTAFLSPQVNPSSPPKQNYRPDTHPGPCSL